MNNKDIRRIIDALETGRYAAHEVAQRFHEEMKGYRHAEHMQVDADVAEIQECIALMEGWIAERAVSPAGESIDTPEFRKKLRNAYLDLQIPMTHKAENELIAHIDAQLVKDHNRGYEAGYKAREKEGPPRDEYVALSQRAEAAEAKLAEWDRVVEVSMAADYANRAIKAESALAARQAPEGEN
jgi:hypothetical protein